MQKILPISIISLLMLIAGHQTCAAGENKDSPEWVNELLSKINQTFQVQARSSSVREPDRLKPNVYFSFQIQGNGYLEKVPDPFEAMDKLFLSDGWKSNERYQADGHGSSSFAYEKEKHFCLISVQIDSACDDEEVGHVPTEFQFTIHCREKPNDQQEEHGKSK